MKTSEFLLAFPYGPCQPGLSTTEYYVYLYRMSVRMERNKVASSRGEAGV
jgi:hypothetical protein